MVGCGSHLDPEFIFRSGEKRLFEFCKMISGNFRNSHFRCVCLGKYLSSSF